MTYVVVFERGKRNWSAYVPDLAGCVTTGKTLEQARAMIAEAVRGHVEAVKRRGYPVPEPSTRAEEIEIGGAA